MEPSTSLPCCYQLQDSTRNPWLYTVPRAGAGSCYGSRDVDQHSYTCQDQTSNLRQPPSFSPPSTGTDRRTLCQQNDACVWPDYTPRSFRTDPEFSCARERSRKPMPPPSPADSVVQETCAHSKKMSHKPSVDSCLVDPACFEPADADAAVSISPEEFEFLRAEIPDPMWNSTYCIERVHSLLVNANGHATAEYMRPGDHELKRRLEARINQLFKFYQLKSPRGVFVQDSNTLKNVLLLHATRPGSGSGFVLEQEFMAEIAQKALAQFRMGLRVQKLRHLAYLDGVVNVLNHFGYLTTTPVTKSDPEGVQFVREIVQLLEHLLDIQTENQSEPAGSCVTKRPERGGGDADSGALVPEEVISDTILGPHLFTECLERSELAQTLVQYIIETQTTTTADGDRDTDSTHSDFTTSTAALTVTGTDTGVDSSSPFYVNIIRLLTKMVDSSEKIRALVLSCPIVEPLLLYLKKQRNGDPNCQALCRTVELIFSLLVKPIETANENEVKALPLPLPPCSVQAFEVLLFRFLQRMRHTISKQLCSLRNDVAFAVYLLAKDIPVLGQHFGRHAFGIFALQQAARVSYIALDTDLDFSVIAGIVANNVLGQEDIPFVLDSSPEDLELLEILLSILQIVLESDARSGEIVRKYELVSVLTRIIIGPCPFLDHLEDDDVGLERVITCVWKALSFVVKKYPLLMLDEEGVQPILKVLRIYCEYGRLKMSVLTILLDLTRLLLTQAHANEDEEEDVHEYKSAPAPVSLQEQVIKHFVHNGATVILTGVLTQLTSKELPVADEPTLCNCLLSCAALCSYDQSQRDIFLQENGVKVLTLLMYKMIYEPAHKRHLDPLLQVSITECAWRSMADSLASLEMFVAFDGIFRVLDLLEIAADPAAELHILSCLVELCEYSRCVGQLLHWKRHMGPVLKRCSHSEEYRVPASRGGRLKPEPGDVAGEVVVGRDQTLAALLCELWRSEETRHGCARDAQGLITSLDSPLTSELSKEYRKSKSTSKSMSAADAVAEGVRNGNGNGPSCLDLISSVRPKIYLLVKKIIEATNTEATVFGSLSLQNQIIINFLDLKRGEIWLETIQELQDEGIPLVDSDATAVERLHNISHNKVSAAIDTQRYLIQRAKEHDEMHERELYNLLQQCHFQNHLLALKEADFFARTTNYFLLADKRLWQKAQLTQAAREGGVGSNARIHRTTDDSLNVTVWPEGRTKMVASEPPHKLDEEGPGAAATARESDQLPPGASAASMRIALVESSSSTFGLDAKTRHILTRVRTEGEVTLPGSNDECYFQVSPMTLQKALFIAAQEQKKWNWSDLESDKAWKMRTKWRSDRYP